MRIQPLIAIDIVKFFGDRRVLDAVNLTANPGQRLGLLGENGAGKTTLLRLLAGHDTPDAGDITRPADTALLHQELPYHPHHTVQDVITGALHESHTLLQHLDTLLTQPHRLDEYATALQRAEQIDAWAADRRADQALHGLGLTTIARHRTLATLSGGQRSRIALAALLVSRPSALLLDEPTNHLDDQALTYLETQLRHHPGIVIVASHDRVFLDQTCTALIDLDPARDGLTRYSGAYTQYLHTKQAQRQQWEQAFATQQDEIAALHHTIATTARQVAHGRPPRDGNKMSYDAHGEKVQASISSRIRNATQRLTTLQRHPIAKPPAPLHFQAPPLTAPDTGDGDLITIRDLTIPGRVHLPHLTLPATGRLLLTGPNGSGKSSLLAAIAGTLPHPHGTITRRKNLRIGLLTQDDHWPDPTRTPHDLYGHHHPTPLADLGLIAPRDLHRPISHLSVGQRRRLALALLIANPPHLLLLDEPTNHLSLTLAEELEAALHTAPGAVIIATHDRWLRRRWQHPELTLKPAPTPAHTT